MSISDGSPIMRILCWICHFQLALPTKVEYPIGQKVWGSRGIRKPLKSHFGSVGRPNVGENPENVGPSLNFLFKWQPHYQEILKMWVLGWISSSDGSPAVIKP